MRDRFGIGTLALYLAVSLGFFGRDLVGSFATLRLGRTVDTSFLMWALVWWPFAIAHHLNPFLCRVAWAPTGFNLAWSGSIPLASIIAAPLTSQLGPVAVYNLLCLLEPGIAAWCAFLLCRHLTNRWWPAVIGGYIFGFSSYVLGQLFAGHLNLLFVFPAPIAALTTMLRLERRIGNVSFAALIAGAFVLEFLLSIELAATLVLFGAIALVVAWVSRDREVRKRIVSVLPPFIVAAVIALILLSPYFYYLFAFAVPRGAINSPGAYSADVLNFVIPSRTVGLGVTIPWPFSSRTSGESGAYIGLPLLALVAIYAQSHWREPAARTLVATFIVVCLLALGPRLHIGGWTGFGLPWKVFTHVPILKSALPGRFMSYAFLAVGVIASLWLADEATAAALRYSAAMLIVVFTLPNPGTSFWTASIDVPAFFSSGAYREYLRPGENIIGIPYGISGNTMLCQAETGMYFRMAGGYTGITPREFESWPVVDALFTQTLIPDAATQLRAFMAAHQADAVIVDDKHATSWTPIFLMLDPSPVRVGGVSLFRVPPHEPAQYRDLTAIEMQRRNCQARFAALLAAARAYLVAGRDPAPLTPLLAQQLGLLPQNWVKDADVRTHNGLYLGPWSGGKIAIGVVGSYEALQPLIARHHADASLIFFPYPKQLSDPPSGDTFMRLLVIVFDRAALVHAGANARNQSF